MNYFQLRNVQASYYSDYKVPSFILENLDLNKSLKILDYGCGHGQLLLALQKLGYTQLSGTDIVRPDWADPNSQIQFIEASREWKNTLSELGKFDIIFMNHVLEHFPKEQIIETLRKIRGLLSPGGKLFVSVPNAQALTGAYWAYEDFTHTCLFTSGSLRYVILAAGFTSIEFKDIDCSGGLPFGKRILRKMAYHGLKFFRKVSLGLTGNSYHEGSPDIFSYEVKAICRN